MQMINQALAMSPEAREAFQKADRARERHCARMDAYGESGYREMAKAEAKRQRRRERNLLRCA